MDYIKRLIADIKLNDGERFIKMILLDTIYTFYAYGHQAKIDQMELLLERTQEWLDKQKVLR